MTDGCRPSLISSISMSRGCDISARATSSIFCSPPESVPARCFRRVGQERKELADTLQAGIERSVVAQTEPQVLLHRQILEQRLFLRRVGDVRRAMRCGGRPVMSSPNSPTLPA